VGFRVGIGYDSHRFVEGRGLFIGGVQIPFNKGLLGHSDGDVLIHSIIDALLGASHLGNIGKLFPDTEDSTKNVSSVKLLQKVVQLLKENGFSIVNVDSTIILEAPRLSRWVLQIEQSLSRVLQIPLENISVKPKTNEKMGFIGRGEGIAAISVCILEK
jgi:2-C-methyl-D-erythritol 2,4-cyclodiphosphate synthase